MTEGLLVYVERNTVPEGWCIMAEGVGKLYGQKGDIKELKLWTASSSIYG